LLEQTRDAGSPPTFPVTGAGDHPTGVTLFSAICIGLYRRERTGKGSSVTTSLLAAGVWACGVPTQGALCDAKLYPLHDRMNPPNPVLNVYRSSDEQWFVIVAVPAKVPDLAKAIGRTDLLTDERFSHPAKLMANLGQLTAILDEAFRSQPMAHWRSALDAIRIPYGLVKNPTEVVKDPQLKENNIVVPIEGAGDLKYTVSTPFQVRGVAKVQARRAPELGEHNDEILGQLGFDAKAIEAFRASGVITKRK
jgi:crotonobetainyl-CoA:carnitine CoA-transferase CaiB-like acyl-CoA transferase